MTMAGKYCRWKLRRLSVIDNITPDGVILSLGNNTLGRGSDRDIQCLSILASRNHCLIVVHDNGSIFIRDQGSLNGTFLGLERVLPHRDISLSDGDLIGIGVQTNDQNDANNCIYRLIRTTLSKKDLPQNEDNSVVPLQNLHRLHSNGEAVFEIHSKSSSQTKSSIKGVTGPVPPLCNNAIPSTSTGITNKTPTTVPLPLLIPKFETIEIDSDEDDVIDNMEKLNSRAVISTCKSADDVSNIISVESDVDNNMCAQNDNKQALGNMSSTDNATSSCKPEVGKNMRLPGESEERSDHSEDINVEERTRNNENDSLTNYEKNEEKDRPNSLVKKESTHSALEKLQISNIEVGQIVDANLVSSDDLLNNEITKNTNHDSNHLYHETSKGTISTDEPLMDVSGSVLQPCRSLSTTQSSKTTYHEKENLEESTINQNDNLLVSLSETLENKNTIPIVPNEDDGDVIINIQTNNEVNCGNATSPEKETVMMSNTLTKEIEDNEVPSVSKLSMASNASTPNNKDMHDKSNVTDNTNRTVSEIDEKIENILKRRISLKLVNVENENNIIDNDPVEKTNNEGTINICASESFTVDDDEIILIEDDDELPCSQMFDVKDEPTLEEDEPTLEEDDQACEEGNADLDDDDVSDTDSADEWFQKLSQCNNDANDDSDDVDSFDDSENVKKQVPLLIEYFEDDDNDICTTEVTKLEKSGAEKVKDTIIEKYDGERDEENGVDINKDVTTIDHLNKKHSSVRGDEQQVLSNEDKSVEIKVKDHVTSDLKRKLSDSSNDSMAQQDSEQSELLLSTEAESKRKLPEYYDKEEEINDFSVEKTSETSQAENSLDEPIVRKAPQGRKRKLESDDEEKEENPKEVIVNLKDLTNKNSTQPSSREQQNKLEKINNTQTFRKKVKHTHEKLSSDKSAKKGSEKEKKKKSRNNKSLAGDTDIVSVLKTDVIEKQSPSKYDETKHKARDESKDQVNSSKTCKLTDRRKSSADSDLSNSSSSSKKLKIFEDEIPINNERKTVLKSDTDSSSGNSLLKSKPKIKKLKRKKESMRKVSTESESSSSSGESGKVKYVKNLQTINEEEPNEENLCAKSGTNPKWYSLMEEYLEGIDKLSIEQSNNLKTEKSLSSEETIAINRTKTNVVPVHNNEQNKESGFEDIEEQITQSTIAKVPSLVLRPDEQVLNEQPSTSSSSLLKPSSEVDSDVRKTERDKVLKLKNLSSEDVKLDAVSKKISASHKKKPISIIEPLPTRKKQGVSIEVEKDILDVQNTDLTSENWLSKDKSETKNLAPIVSKSDKKAYIKAKLADLTKKQKLAANIAEEKTKTLSSAKNTTKVTSKSRNEFLLADLVSTDNTLKEKNEKDIGKNKGSLSSFKIPRRPSKVDEERDEQNKQANILEEATASTSKLSENTSRLLSAKPNNKSTKPLKPSKSKDTTENSVITSVKQAESNNRFSIVDKILSEPMSNTVSKKLNPRVAHVPKIGIPGESTQSIIVKILPDIKNQAPLDVTHPKSIVKTTGGGMSRGKENKTVKFHQFGENENVVYVQQREFEVSEGSILKPLPKNVAKTDRLPQPNRKSELRNAPYKDYTEETLHQICKWNTSWFDEKNNVRGEPSVFTGQVYHLSDDFAGYNDYRRGMFPLLLYQLWQSVSKQYDHIKNKSKPFIIEIRNMTSMPVRNQFVPPQRENENRALSRLDCQMVLERDNRIIWPRQGDLVVLEVKMRAKTANGKELLPLNDSRAGLTTRRKLAYLKTNTVRAIATHKDVSHSLRLKFPRASQVMDFSLFVREEPFVIVTTQETRISILKNIKPELRQFDALDRLPSSPLLNIICHPKENCTPLSPVDINKAAIAPIAHLNYSQKKAVVTVATACLNEVSMVHLVHGPPGCGKSEVIIGIIQQMWHMWFQAHNKTHDPAPRILLCAPSNAAIDDVFLRLMSIRQGITKMPKFNMVRIGRTDMTHKNVSSLTLECLVEKELKKTKDLMEDEAEKVIELGTLEAKKNQMTYQLENLGKRKNDFQYIKKTQKKLAEVIERIKQLQSGKHDKAHDGREFRERKKETEMRLLENANIIATTLSSCYNAQMEQGNLSKRLQFTCCIVDEATQCTEPDTLIPLMLGVNNLVLVGDPQQLPATVLSPKAKEHGLERSLFARQQEWWKKQNRDPALLESRFHFLNTQYRMHPAIAQWPSEHFYNGTILSHKDLENRSVNCPLLPYVILSHEFPQSKQEECNHEEVRMVVSLVRSIIRWYSNDRLTIGVITPYNRQKDVIRHKLEADLMPNVEVGTVDSYQGRERDIVIFSCVRTEGVGFMSGTERLNVALTRARHSLIICGNFVSLQKDPTWASLLANAKNRRVVKTVRKDNNVDLLQEVLKPDFVNKIM